MPTTSLPTLTLNLTLTATTLLILALALSANSAPSTSPPLSDKLQNPLSQPSIQLPLSHPPPTLRPIQQSDIPALTTLWVAAFAPGPMYNYVAPNLTAHRKAFEACFQSQLELAWSVHNATTTLGNVLTVADELVSMAIWQLRSTEWEGEPREAEEQQSDGFDLDIHALASSCQNGHMPGVNSTRLASYSKQVAKIENKYFSLSHSVPEFLYLGVLATHPDWDGNRFAAEQIAWGKELAKQPPVGSGAAWPVKLLATPAGYPLYDSLGFESVANATIEKLDGLGELWFEVMEWRET